MKVTLESTTRMVDVIVDGQRVPARLWEGETANGVRCHAYITRIAVHRDDDNAEFERDLKECIEPSDAVATVPAILYPMETLPPRAEHLAWCKQRALALVDAGEVTAALASMLSDLTKHPDTADSARDLAMAAIVEAHEGTPETARRFIEGFN